MIRRDAAYWQRLRKDRRSDAAAILAAVAALLATLSVIGLAVPGAQAQARANPLYWALMLPMVWWVSGLTTFAPRYVRLWPAALVLCCVAGCGSLAFAMALQEDWAVWAVGCGLTLAAAAASGLLYRGSLVAREGPAR